MNDSESSGKRQPTKTFRDLLVWQRAHEFVLDVYRFSAAFPQHELFGLTSQIRRSSVSVLGNIAEGYKRRGRKDKARFLNTAQASLEECSYYLTLAKDLGYGDVTSLWVRYEDVSKLLNRYEAAVRPNLLSWVAPFLPFLKF